MVIGLYFHIPFCTRKCPYCHFYVIPNNQEHHDILLEALYLEWQRIRPNLSSFEVVSIYFGGGTPTLFGAKAIHSLLLKISSEARIAPDCEITIEANPEDAALPLMEELKQAGINRVSIGVQSLEDSSLIELGRTHNASRAINAITSTFEAGIENISIDLMFELPNQTVQSFERTLQRLKELPITHLSLYNLTIEPHTPFSKRKLKLPCAEDNLQMLQTAVAALEDLGLKRYEISAFAKPSFRSRHNLGYWTARPFFGLGPSAFSYFEGKRFRNVAHLNRYARALKENSSPVDFVEELVFPDNVHELLAVRLRLLEGANLENYFLPEPTRKKIDLLAQEGFLSVENTQCRLTEKGLLFYDTVASELI